MDGAKKFVEIASKTSSVIVFIFNLFIVIKYITFTITNI
ncbi:hypothetical protein PHEL85_1515 [Polaribacter sp. Hel1_85]|nr:hypothetical protein PHEL85_1515 [Polaribacter sp. Hel1_85]